MTLNQLVLGALFAIPGVIIILENWKNGGIRNRKVWVGMGLVICGVLMASRDSLVGYVAGLMQPGGGK